MGKEHLDYAALKNVGDVQQILQELGLSQYVEAFLEQGFDTWETVLDITESDLLVLTTPDASVAECFYIAMLWVSSSAIDA